MFRFYGCDGVLSAPLVEHDAKYRSGGGADSWLDSHQKYVSDRRRHVLAPVNVEAQPVSHTPKICVGCRFSLCTRHVNGSGKQLL